MGQAPTSLAMPFRRIELAVILMFVEVNRVSCRTRVPVWLLD